MNIVTFVPTAALPFGPVTCPFTDEVVVFAATSIETIAVDKESPTTNALAIRDKE